MADEHAERVTPEADVRALELDLGIREGFFQELLESGDDWSFVIKAHALIEAAVSYLLMEVSGRPELLDLYSQLELSNVRVGKVAFAKALGCLEADERTTIRKLSELRNRLVHDVSNVSFDFLGWTESLDSNQLRQWAEAFGPGGEEVTIHGRTVSSLSFFRDNPRLCIWLACWYVLSLIYQRKDLAAEGRKVAMRKMSFLDDLIDKDFFSQTSEFIDAVRSDRATDAASPKRTR